MRYNKIRKMDISIGPGIRVSIFMQGCTFHCKNCFNSETWDFNKGIEFTDETINTVLELCSNSHVTGLSILGGEPLLEQNRQIVSDLIDYIKKLVYLYDYNEGDVIRAEYATADYTSICTSGCGCHDHFRRSGFFVPFSAQNDPGVRAVLFQICKDEIEITVFDVDLVAF